MGSSKQIFQFYPLPNGTLVYAPRSIFERLRIVLNNQSDYRIFFGLDSFVVFHDHELENPKLEKYLNGLMHQVDENERVPEKVVIPVFYNFDSKDWPFLETYLSKSREEIVQLHTNCRHAIAMYGFLPGFAYIKNDQVNFEIPRKDKPATKVLPGTVAMAGNYTGIYPVESPGGWHLIGKCPVKFLIPQAEIPIKYNLGSIIEFKAITEQEFINLNEYE